VNRILEAQSVPSDPLYARQRWHYEAAELPAAWEITTGSPNVTVAVVDSGAARNHPDLEAKFIDGYDMVDRDANFEDPGGESSFHGTHVLGTVGAIANNGEGGAGIELIFKRGRRVQCLQPVEVDAHELEPALSPLLAMYAAYPSADTPGMWFVLAANWLLLLAAKRNNLWLALGAGAVLGIACWIRVNPLYLAVGWAIVLLLVTKAGWRRRVAMGAAVVFATALVIAPLIVRNYLTFPDFTPTGGTIGVNLWEGLGETELGRQHGFLFGDDKMIEHERVKMGWPANVYFDSQWPDGIRRDKERTRESMDFIKQHPVWYAGVMVGRMWGMLKVAGDPVPYCGISGINVTSRRCLPPAWQGGVVAFGANVLGMLQSVARYLFLPLAAFGIWVAARKDWVVTAVLFVTIIYYLVPGTAAHTEIRYVLPMHALLTVFAAATLDRILQVVRTK